VFTAYADFASSINTTDVPDPQLVIDVSFSSENIFRTNVDYPRNMHDPKELSFYYSQSDPSLSVILYQYDGLFVGYNYDTWNISLLRPIAIGTIRDLAQNYLTRETSADINIDLSPVGRAHFTIEFIPIVPDPTGGGGAIWISFDNYRIMWSPEGFPSDSVRIMLQRDSDRNETVTIVDSTDNDGSYSYTVSDSYDSGNKLSDGRDYYVLIIALSQDYQYYPEPIMSRSTFFTLDAPTGPSCDSQTCSSHAHCQMNGNLPQCVCDSGYSYKQGVCTSDTAPPPSDDSAMSHARTVTIIVTSVVGASAFCAIIFYLRKRKQAALLSGSGADASDRPNPELSSSPNTYDPLSNLELKESKESI